MSKLMFNKNAVGGGSPTRAALVTYVEEDGQIVSVQDKIKNMEEVVSLTQAEYDALPGTKLTDNKLYLIQDADDEMDAYNITYKNTTVGDELDTQKQSIVDLQKKVVAKDFNLTIGTETWGNFYYADLDLSSEIATNGKIISAIPVSSGQNSVFFCYVFGNGGTTVRAMGFVKSINCAIRVTFEK